MELDPANKAAYLYTAVPVTQNQTGVRSFCTDGSGMVYAAGAPGELRDPERTAFCSSDLRPLGSS
jgi:hypothetical protein